MLIGACNSVSCPIRFLKFFRVDGHLRNDLPAADNLHVVDNKTAQQANRKLRSLPPDTTDPAAELTDVVRRAVVTRSAQAREIWVTNIQKHGEKRGYFGLMSRTNTFANPSAMVKNDVVVLVRPVATPFLVMLWPCQPRNCPPVPGFRCDDTVHFRDPPPFYIYIYTCRGGPCTTPRCCAYHATSHVATETGLHPTRR